MVQISSILKVVDNSGVQKVRCLKIYGSLVGKLGSVVLLSVVEAKSQSKIKKGALFKGVVVRLKQQKVWNCGCSLEFNENSVVLLNKKLGLYGTRCFGPMSKYLKKKSFLKILSLSSVII